MDARKVLGKIADDELARMSGVPWDSYARLIYERAPRPAGETYGCDVDGAYVDVGVRAVWADAPDGDIILTAFASMESGFDGPLRVERTATISHP